MATRSKEQQPRFRRKQSSAEYYRTSDASLEAGRKRRALEAIEEWRDLQAYVREIWEE